VIASKLLSFIGVILIIIGLMLVIAPKLMSEGRVHPLLLVRVRFGDFWIGTSPLLFIVLVIIYLALKYFKVL